MSDSFFMAKALVLAEKAQSMGEVPIGAIIVDERGVIIGQGHNMTITQCNPTAHAEMIAIQKAAETIDNHRLLNATMFVTLEPCPMCAGALIQSRLKRLVFSCRDFKTGACGGVINIINGPASNHRMIVDEGIFAQKSSDMLTNFFEQKR